MRGRRLGVSALVGMFWVWWLGAWLFDAVAEE
jgi:hypothetical protein